MKSAVKAAAATPTMISFVSSGVISEDLILAETIPRVITEQPKTTSPLANKQDAFMAVSLTKTGQPPTLSNRLTVAVPGLRSDPRPQLFR